jgi:hypothetical protein
MTGLVYEVSLVRDYELALRLPERWVAVRRWLLPAAQASLRRGLPVSGPLGRARDEHDNTFFLRIFLQKSFLLRH